MKNDNTPFRKASKDLIGKVKELEANNSAVSNPSWDEIEKRILQVRKNSRRKYLYIASAAASFLIIITLSYFMLFPENDSGLLSLALLENEIPADTKEIILTAREKQIHIQDESDIKYETDGNIHVNEESLETTLVSSGEAAKEMEDIHQIYVPYGKRARTTFSDGTVMYINSGTRVIYPAFFAKNKREIIVEGEVFLDVRTDEKKPFIVKTNGFDIQVLGTRFNVNSYRDLNDATVALVSGSVEIITPGHINNILIPNQIYRKTGESVNIREVDIYEYICWIDNIMLLNNQKSAGEVFENLMRNYGETIIYDKEIAQIPINGKLDMRENLEDVLDIICKSLYLDLSRNEDGNYVITLN